MRLLASLLFAVPVAVLAQAFPVKPVQMMVAYPAGGSTDIAADRRAIAEKARPEHRVVNNGAPSAVLLDRDSRAKPTLQTRLSPSRLNTVILDPDRQAAFKEDAFVPDPPVPHPASSWSGDTPTKPEGLIDAREEPQKISARPPSSERRPPGDLMMEEAASGAMFASCTSRARAVMTRVMAAHQTARSQRPRCSGASDRQLRRWR